VLTQSSKFIFSTQIRIEFDDECEFQDLGHLDSKALKALLLKALCQESNLRPCDSDAAL
jgi:hypothetical protein